MIGIILHIRPMEGCFRDSGGYDQVHLCTILMNETLPDWLGNGRIAEFTDSILEVVS